MPEKKKKVNKAKKKLPRVIFPEEVNTIYSNSAFFLMTDRDLTIDFGIRRPEMSPEDLSNAPTQISTRIIMSPQHAKSFSDKLNDLIKGYEKDWGKIPTEPKKK